MLSNGQTGSALLLPGPLLQLTEEAVGLPRELGVVVLWARQQSHMIGPTIILREAGNMPRVSEIESDGGDATLSAVFEKETAAFGHVLNTTKVLANCPPILAAAKQLGAAIDRSGQLPAELLPIVYLRVATLNGCPF